MNKWHINKRRQKTGTYNLNCLFQSDFIFVMDNHKAALWSWLQLVDGNTSLNFMHIDRHYDLLNNNLSSSVSRINNFKSGNISKYSISDYDSLKFKISSNEIPVFRYDNFFPIGYKLYPNLFENLLFITHKDGDLPEEYDLIEKSLFDTGENLDFWFERHSDGNKWIVDLDIDFFFTDNQNDNPVDFLSIKYAELIAKQLYEKRDLIEAFTIALSPKFCPNWDKSIEFANVFCNKFGFQFKF